VRKPQSRATIADTDESCQVLDAYAHRQLGKSLVILRFAKVYDPFEWDLVARYIARQGAREERKQMRANSKVSHVATGIALLLSLVMIAGVPALGQRKSTETIDATAFGSSTQLGRNFGVKITIYEFSSPEDRDILVQAFQQGQNDGLVNALERMKSVGRITIPGTLGYDLSFIREIITPTGRTIRFVTNRKIAFGESYWNSQTKSFNLTAGEININDKEKDKSGGVLFPATQLIINKEGELQWELNQNEWKLINIIEWD
jgi:hypothetical protein